MDYKRLFYNNPNPCWIFDTETLKFLAVNRAAIEKYGYDEASFLQLNIYDIRPSDDVTEFEKRLQVIDADDIYNDVWRHKTKDGKIFYVRVFSQITEYNGRKARFVTAVDIDKKVKLEKHNSILNQMLFEQKQQLENILTAVHEAVWSCDAKDYKMQFINGACEWIFGYKPDELIGRSGILTSNVHPEDKAKVALEMQHLMASGSASFRFRIYHKNGTLKHVLHNCTVQKDADGLPVSITGVSVDVTGEEVAREQLAASAEKMEELLESITDAFFALDKDWNFTYINNECELLYHPLRRKEILGQNFWKVFPTAQQLRFHEALPTAMEQRITVEFEEYSPTADKWFAVKGYPTKEGISVFMRDITETKQLQEELRLEQQTIRAIINNTTDVIWSLDKDYKLSYFNHCYSSLIEKWSGRKPKIGDDTGLYARGEEDRDIWRSYYQRGLSGEIFRVEDEYPFDEEVHYVDTRFYPICDTDGSVIGVSCNSRDITEYRRHIKLVEEQNRKLKEIAWIQSHKFRGPLATLLGLISIYDKENCNQESNKEILEKISQTALLLDNVIQEVISTTHK